jgi:hypothetical protein
LTPDKSFEARTGNLRDGAAGNEQPAVAFADLMTSPPLSTKTGIDPDASGANSILHVGEDATNARW